VWEGSAETLFNHLCTTDIFTLLILTHCKLAVPLKTFTLVPISNAAPKDGASHMTTRTALSNSRTVEENSDGTVCIYLLQYIACILIRGMHKSNEATELSQYPDYAVPHNNLNLYHERTSRFGSSEM
jgi:hypothetical protein